VIDLLPLHPCLSGMSLGKAFDAVFVSSCV
jgi:hypothetical protein